MNINVELSLKGIKVVSALCTCVLRPVNAEIEVIKTRLNAYSYVSQDALYTKQSLELTSAYGDKLVRNIYNVHRLRLAF